MTRGTSMLWAVISLIIATAVPLLVYQYFTKQKPVVVYVLSSPIPLSTEGTASVQQLRIENIGNKAADNVRVHISKPLRQFDLMPIATTDEYSKTDAERELRYKVVPPSAGFTLLLSAETGAVHESDLDILHDGGPAQSGLKRQSSAVGPALFTLLAYGSLAVWFVFSMLSMRADNLLWKSAANPDKILLAPPEWLVSSKHQDLLRKRAEESLPLAIHSNSADALQRTPAAKVLASPKFPQLHPETQTAARRAFKAHALEAANWLENPARALAVLRMPFPAGMDDTSSEELRAKLASVYAETLGSSIKTGWGELPTIDFEAVPLDTRLSFRDEIAKAVTTAICGAYARFDGTGAEKLNRSYGAGLLSDEQQALVARFRFVYQNLESLGDITTAGGAAAILERESLLESFPAWKRDKLRRLLERLAALDESEASCSVTRDLLDRIKADRPLPDERPDAISAEDWDLLKGLAESLAQVRADRRAAGDARRKFEADSELATKQLELIHRVLSDPDSIDRLEPYQIPFSPGNYENLRQVAELLKATAPASDGDQ